MAKEQSTKARKPRGPRALIKFTVSIHDPLTAEFLKMKLGEAEAIQQWVSEQLNSLAQPALEKIAELKKKHEEEMSKILGESAE
jgi:hypothetical protein